MGTAMNVDDDDLALLHSDPRALLPKFQNIFLAVSWVYRRSGLINPDEQSDIVQEMNLQFLSNLNTIKRNFDPSKSNGAGLRGYVRSLARNVCRKYYRDHPEFKPLPIMDPRFSVDEKSITDPIVIRHTIRVFHAAIETVGDRKPKLLLFLKLYYRIPVQGRELRAAYPSLEEVQEHKFLGTFGGDFDRMGEMEVFETARPTLNALEHSTTSAESYTRWITREVNDLCDILNGDPPVSAFDRHSLRVLVDDYFEPHLLRDTEHVSLSWTRPERISKTGTRN